MHLTFNQKKSTQAAATFLKLANGQMNYMKLVKLLYLADRAAFLGWGRPITGDRYFLMKLGPVLSCVHDLITEVPCPGEDTFWSTYISPPSNYEITLKNDPGNDELSKAELRVIDEIYKAYGQYRPFDLVDLMHKTLPEWTPIAEGRLPLEYRDILKSGGLSQEQIEQIETEIDNLRFVESVLQPA